MHVPIPAGARWRTRRAVLAAALAAVALPAAADAATVELVNSGGNGVVAYNGEPGESNNVRVSLTGRGIEIDDAVQIRSLDSECTTPSTGLTICPATAGHILVFAGDRNDTIQYKAPHRGFVSGGNGADIMFGGLQQAGFGRQVEGVMYRGKDLSNDTVTDILSYVFADRAVKVDLADQNAAATFSDGRPGIDHDQIEDDIEVVEGSDFDDTLFGSDSNDTFRGLNGDDVISGRGGNDFSDEGSAPNGGDRFSGGIGTDRVSYGTRTSGVSVSLDSVRNDGAVGENDNVGPSVENIGGSNFRDVLMGDSVANRIDGFGGNDTIDGLGGNDTLSTGAGNNRVTGGAGSDVIFARNFAIDDVDCGTETDTLDRDADENLVRGCEKAQVGVLRLAPRALRVRAGETAKLRLSWRHPQGWRKLRMIELRLTRDRMPVGEVTIRPRGGRIGADGAVKLLRKHSRLTRKGKTVTARLAVRLDESLAGQTLQAEVEATDRRGRRQLERDAATVRIAD